MVPPVDEFAKAIKSLYNDVVSHYRTVHYEIGRPDFPLRLWFYEARTKGKPRKVTISGRVTILPTGPWGGESMADLRIGNLPVELANGKGSVDFLLTFFVSGNPHVEPQGVHVNRVIRFKGSNIDDFVTEFRSAFASGWNKRH
jgi:hypothetical protein